MITDPRRSMPAIAAPSRLRSCAIVTLSIAAMAAAVILVVLTLGWLAMMEDRAHARDLGQWQAVDPEIRRWYQSLMQPDVPTRELLRRGRRLLGR
jgi:hypothetical protein